MFIIIWASDLLWNIFNKNFKIIARDGQEVGRNRYSHVGRMESGRIKYKHH
jgi:hypothetical protein